MKMFAIIPAGGKGLRSGFRIPKQYLRINGRELIVYTLEVFQKNNNIDAIYIPAETKYFNLLEKLKIKYNLTKVQKLIKGGKERQNSVLNALTSLPASGHDLVVVHDAARPLLPQNVLTNAILKAKEKGNAVVCIKAKDTMIKGKKYVQEYINRSFIYNVQTPQIFKFGDLYRAMQKANEENFIGTDESMVVSRTGKKIYIVEGSPLNFKITSPEDVELFKKLIEN
jgi:2-C-methyl-D-erythritol 4-phosphate cytidylyltransferase